MSNLGSGYDNDVCVYSPDGRSFQIEYAAKAVENSSTAVALRCSDGVVFAIDKVRPGKAVCGDTASRAVPLSRYAGAAFGGIQADARDVVEQAHGDVLQHKDYYDEVMPTKILASHVGATLFRKTMVTTQQSRPMGCAFMIGGVDPETSPALYVIDPAGAVQLAKAYAVGNHAQGARSSLETRLVPELAGQTCADVIRPLARLVVNLHDEEKDHAMLLEVAWVDATGFHKMPAQEAADLQRALEAEREAGN